MIFGINIFPSDVYYLEKMPSEINVISVCIVFFLSLLITSLASYFPAKFYKTAELDPENRRLQ